MGVVSRRWLWLVGVGGIYGCGQQEVSVISACGCKELYRFPHITYPYSSRICSSILLFVHFFMFFVLVPVHFVIYLIFFCRNIRATTGVPRKPFERLHMFYA